ncbi:MAG: outer membrane protein assembly factor BamD [Acidobacteria bacterium]|nr:outer membrane protein assembly factor BamD [Acidobacteriota bacterium]
MRRWFFAGVILTLLLGAAGCSSTSPEDQLISKLQNTDKQTVFNKAEALYQKGKYTEARKLFSFLYDTFPNDPLGHKAALRVADTYYQHKDVGNLTEARLRYRDFANRFPNDPDRDYALLMLGNTYTKRMLSPDRDLAQTRDALKAYQQLLNLYPHSKYASEARQKVAEVKKVLAQHEWRVAVFYARNKVWLATIWRLQYLKEHYPQYPQMKQVDQLLTEAKKARAELRKRDRERYEEYLKKHKKKNRKEK